MRLFFRLCLLHLFISVITCHAQNLNERDTVYKHQITAFPYPAYAQETSWEFGVLSVFQFKMPDATFGTRPSNATFIGFYTLENQLRLKLEHTIFTKNEDWLLEGTWEHSRYPEKYYGVGSNTSNEDEQLVDWSKIDFRQQILKKLKEKMFLGLQLRYANYWDISLGPKKDGTPADITTLPGYEGGSVSGLGTTYKWDTRDLVLSPKEGFFIEGRFEVYNSIFGSDYNFNVLTLDLRKYFDLSREKEGASVLAFQGLTKQTFGDNTPFREMALMGGLNMMRGVYEGRWRDQKMVALQSEFRQHLFWRIGMTAFVGTANVFSTYENFDSQGFKFAGGGGLRFLINKKDKASIRVDYGIGSEKSSGLYLTFGEAF
ncbi:BamA/TamA family outer membrane protein [Flammeovirga sp. MY04]|uniref:BamA/TamA family outer membrane protein n=1 Tax=Flammeovirga sp. MY04 TaxID=1191459 RepID=UPI0008063CD3|nr:BamA/TamA family outer membrane protein [Flammeovirga sp. MY04]ANQ48085.1 BamA/TamA family outer membrane protein [Flammeovirga sp. MY04]